jgi:hypothetical protein
MDIDQAAQAMRDEEMMAEIEDFIEGFNQPTFRGIRVNGVPGRYLVLPARVVRGRPARGGVAPISGNQSETGGGNNSLFAGTGKLPS